MNTRKKIKVKTSSPLIVEFEKEVDGRWIAEIPNMPGVMAYGLSKKEAQHKVSAIALRTLADKMEQGNVFPSVNRLFKYEVVRG